MELSKWCEVAEKGGGQMDGEVLEEGADLKVLQTQECALIHAIEEQ